MASKKGCDGRRSGRIDNLALCRIRGIKQVQLIEGDRTKAGRAARKAEIGSEGENVIKLLANTH